MIHEDDIIKKIALNFKNLPHNVHGIGDDCAVIQISDNQSLLITTDNLCETVHFDQRYSDPKSLGYKAIMVNVSDIAAMGGIPQYAQIGFSAPKDISESWIDLFIAGIKEACDATHTILTGGDTTASPQHIFLSVTLVGTQTPQQIKYRHKAQHGDYICLTKTIGDSYAGLKTLCNKIKQTDDVLALQERHLRPIAHLKQGQWLGNQKAVHAMMDISDGLHTDLTSMIQKSDCGAVIDIDSLPFSDALKSVAKKQYWDLNNIGLSGGEDYGLLFTCQKDSLENIHTQYISEFSEEFFVVGHINQRIKEISYLQKGRKITPKIKPFNHF